MLLGQLVGTGDSEVSQAICTQYTPPPLEQLSFLEVTDPHPGLGLYVS